jgi:hypothetical protein
MPKVAALKNWLLEMGKAFPTPAEALARHASEFGLVPALQATKLPPARTDAVVAEASTRNARARRKA